MRRSALVPLVFLAAAHSAWAVVPERAVAGWAERARLLPSGIELDAKLDSGAENSSLHIEHQRLFRRDGERWVRFAVEGASGRRVAFERRLIRYAAIKRHSGRSDQRPVVRMKICLGAVVKEVEVNLVDRSRFEYALLIGRSFLDGEYLIDTATTGVTSLSCGDEVD